MDLPRIGLGGGPLGNYLTAIDDAQALSVLETAWASGIRYFDTAPFYGYGLSERRFGSFLRGVPRHEFLLSTKVGRLVRPGDDGSGMFKTPPGWTCGWDFSRDGVLRSIEESLARLGLDHIDIALVHDPDHHWPQALDEAFATLADLRSQGVVSFIGAGMNQARMLARFVRLADPDLVIAANTWTLLRRSALAELLPLCLERNVVVVAAGVFHRGLLATSQQSAVGERAPEEFRRIVEVCARHGIPVSAAAMRFPFTHPAVRSVLIGAHTPAQLEANIAAFAHPVPHWFWGELDGPQPPESCGPPSQ